MLVFSSSAFQKSYYWILSTKWISLLNRLEIQQRVVPLKMGKQLEEVFAYESDAPLYQIPPVIKLKIFLWSSSTWPSIKFFLSFYGAVSGSGEGGIDSIPGSCYQQLRSSSDKLLACLSMTSQILPMPKWTTDNKDFHFLVQRHCITFLQDT